MMAMVHSVLIIEDDAQVRDIVARYLTRDGFNALTAENGAEGLRLVDLHHPQLVLLDINLPDTDGWAILRRLRLVREVQPAVILLTAHSDEPDRLLGLDLGADDYIVKPFSPREVVARVKAVLRRMLPPAEKGDELLFPGLRIDLSGRMAYRNSAALALTPKEFDLLALLARRANRVIPRLSLYDQVWGDDGAGDDHTLDVHINRLRRKLAHDDGISYLLTIKGVGMKFEVMHAAE